MDRRSELRAHGGHAIALRAASGDRLDHARLSVDLADRVVAGVGDVEVAQDVDRESGRTTDRGGRGAFAVTEKCGHARAGHRGHRFVRFARHQAVGTAVDATHAVPFPLRDEQVAGVVEGQAVREGELGGGSGEPVAVEPRRARPRHGADHTGQRVDAPHPVVGAIGDERVASVVPDEAGGRVERGDPGQLAVVQVVGGVAARAVEGAGGPSGAGDRGESGVRRRRVVDRVGGRIRVQELPGGKWPQVRDAGEERGNERADGPAAAHCPYDLVAVVGNDQGAVRIQPGRGRSVQAGGRGRSAVAAVGGVSVADHGIDRGQGGGIDLRPAPQVRSGGDVERAVAVVADSRGVHQARAERWNAERRARASARDRLDAPGAVRRHAAHESQGVDDSVQILRARHEGHGRRIPERGLKCWRSLHHVVGGIATLPVDLSVYEAVPRVGGEHEYLEIDAPESCATRHRLFEEVQADAGGIDGYCGNRPQRGGCGRHAVQVVVGGIAALAVDGAAHHAVAGEGADDAVLHGPDAPATEVRGEVEDAVRVEGEVGQGVAEARAGGRPVVAGVATGAGAGYGRDQAGGQVDCADDVVVHLGDVEPVLPFVESQAVGVVELRLERGTAIPRVSAETATR